MQNVFLCAAKWYSHSHTLRLLLKMFSQVVQYDNYLVKIRSFNSSRVKLIWQPKLWKGSNLTWFDKKYKPNFFLITICTSYFSRWIILHKRKISYLSWIGNVALMVIIESTAYIRLSKIRIPKSKMQDKRFIRKTICGDFLLQISHSTPNRVNQKVKSAHWLFYQIHPYKYASAFLKKEKKTPTRSGN